MCSISLSFSQAQSSDVCVISHCFRSYVFLSLYSYFYFFYLFFYFYIAQTLCSFFFFFNDTAPTEIYPLSLHDALPIWRRARRVARDAGPARLCRGAPRRTGGAANRAGARECGGFRRRARRRSRERDRDHREIGRAHV